MLQCGHNGKTEFSYSSQSNKVPFRWSGRFVFTLIGSIQLRYAQSSNVAICASHLHFQLDLSLSNLTFQAIIRAQCCRMGETSSF